MNRTFFAALAAALAAAALAPAGARAQVIVTVPAAPPGAAAPLVNGAVRTLVSPVWLDVANGGAGTVTELVVELATGTPVVMSAAGPSGWTVANITGHGQRDIVTFRIATCGQGGIAPGTSARFRLDVLETATGLDGTFAFRAQNSRARDVCVVPNAAYTLTLPPSVPVRALGLAAAATPAAGASGTATTVTYAVTNYSGAQRTASAPTPVVTPAAGATIGACTPATLAILAGASGVFSCPVTLTAASPTEFTIAANVSATAGAVSGIGAAVKVVVGAATATFALDQLDAAPGQTVRATLQVTNNTAAPLSVTPPGYGQLTLAGLAREAGVLDPVAGAALAPGATASFTYVLRVTGLYGDAYAATAAAPTGAGSTNAATTPPGTVGGWRTTWSPPVVVTGRTAAPYGFTVSVTNGSAGTVPSVALVNPQNTVWTGMAVASTTAYTCAAPVIAGTTTTVTCTLTTPLAQGATATFAPTFTSVGPAGTYPLRVTVNGAGGFAIQTMTRTVTVRSAVDFDVANLTVGSTAAGNTLRWTNTSTASGTHDGVVVFRTAAPAVPQLPTDFVEYAAGTGQAVYADRYASPVTSFVDPTPGAFNYRVCNHDAAFVYSNCSSGFWNGAGWLDSAPAPAGGWTHQVGAGVYLAPGLIPGAGMVGVATNGPSVVALGTAAGARTVDPAPLGSVPASGTPAVQLGDGLRGLFAADTGGGVTAVDLASGKVAWSRTLAPESFVGGVTGALSSMLPAAYGTDVLFLGSTTGNLLALDARTGATLWTLPVGTAVRSLATYDFNATSWRLYVATDGGGILAYDLVGAAQPGAPAWTSAAAAYTLGCISQSTASLACATSAGEVQLVDKASGAVTASLPTGLTTPTSIWRAGSGALVVSDASQLVRLTVSAGALAESGRYAPGLTLGRPQVFVADGFVYVGGSDLMVHKLSLSSLAEILPPAALTSPAAGAVLGQPAYDTTTDRLIVGASDGRVWALPKF